jgi:hypothetical protein
VRSACIQVAKTKLDWRVGMSHARFSGLTRTYADTEDKIRLVLRLDPTSALDDVRPKALERAHSRLSRPWVPAFACSF